MKKTLAIYSINKSAPKPNKPLTPGVCTVVINKDKEIVLHQRSDNDDWSLPGGQMEIGESISDCLLREVREETGLQPKIVRLIGLYTSPKIIFQFPNGDVYQSFVVVFLCKVRDEKVTLNNESTSFKWVKKGEVNKLKTLPLVKEIISDAFLKSYTVF